VKSSFSWQKHPIQGLKHASICQQLSLGLQKTIFQFEPCPEDPGAPLKTPRLNTDGSGTNDLRDAMPMAMLG